MSYSYILPLDLSSASFTLLAPMSAARLCETGDFSGFRGAFLDSEQTKQLDLLLLASQEVGFK